MEKITGKRRGRPRKNILSPEPAIEGADEAGIDGAGRQHGAAPDGGNEQAKVVVREVEGLDDFLGRVDAWQALNLEARVCSARFPSADKSHVNVFNGFKVTDGPAGVTLATGETIDI